MPLSFHLIYFLVLLYHTCTKRHERKSCLFKELLSKWNSNNRNASLYILPKSKSIPHQTSGRIPAPRFTGASLAKNQGQCEQDIQHNLGHSNIQQTQHYDSHATTEYNYGMAADIYDKKYNVTKCNQTFEHKKIAPNLDKLKA